MDSGASTANSNKSWSDEDVSNALESFKAERAAMVRQQAEQARLQAKQQEEQARIHAQQMEALKKQQQDLAALMSKIHQKGSLQVSSDEEDGSPQRRKRLHRSCPDRTDNQDAASRSALKGKRRSRGGSISAPKVRFAENDLGTSSDEDKVQSTASALGRGRVRRISRGPDGQTYNVRTKVEGRGAEKESTKADASGSSTAAAAGGVAGGVMGLAGGVITGAVAALPAALFTFGLSIPIGAAFGGGIGVAAGGSAGAALGYRMTASGSSSKLPTYEEAKKEEDDDNN